MLANATNTYVVNSYKLDVAQIANFQHGVKPQPKVIQDLNADLIQSRIRIIQICMSDRSLPKCCGFITFLTSVILPSVVKIG